MFKLASLVAVTAAATTEAEAKASLKKDEKTLKHLMIKGHSKVGKHFTMPEVDSKAVTWGYLTEKRYDCWSCAFTWGFWSPAGGCFFDGDPHTAGLKADAVTISPDFTYKRLFFNLEQCANWQPYSTVQALDAKDFDATKNQVHGTGCASSWDATKFIAGTDTGKGTKATSWDYTWDATSTGGWCYQRTVMPKTFKGGLLITHANDLDTAFAMKIDGTKKTYFDNVSLKKQGIGKTGKVAQLTANAFHLLIQSKKDFTKAANASAGFNITVTRASYGEITMLTLEKGGVIVWVVIGIVVCILMTCAFCAWRHFHNKKESEDQFYQIEDNYARI